MQLIEKLSSFKAVVVVLMLVLVADGFLLYRYQQSLPDTGAVGATQPDTGPASPTTEETSNLLEREEPTMATETTTEGTTDSPAKTGGANGPQVDVRVVGTPAWLRVQQDGRTVLEQRTPPGFSRRFEADQEIKIRTGNAGATYVGANGRDVVPLGASGEVGTWTFRVGPESRK